MLENFVLEQIWINPLLPRKLSFRTTGFISFSVAGKKARRMLIMRKTPLFQITFASVWMISNQYHEEAFQEFVGLSHFFY